MTQFEPSLGWLRRRAAEAEEVQSRRKLVGPYSEDAPAKTPSKQPNGAPPRQMMPQKPMSPMVPPPPGLDMTGFPTGGDFAPGQFMDDPGMDPLGLMPEPQMPGMGGPPGRGAPGGGGIGQDPVMQRQQTPMSDPRQQGPSTRGDPLKKMHSPQSPGPTKSPSSGPSGKPPASSPSHGPGGGSGTPTMSHAQAAQFIAMTLSDLGLSNAPMQVPPVSPQQPPRAPARPAGPPSPSSTTSGSPGVQMGGLEGDGFLRESESDWGPHPYLTDKNIAARKGQMFSRLRLR